jgi:serine/threonine protein kinase
MKYINGNIILNPKKKSHLNTIRFDNVDYLLTNLNEKFKGKSKGGNSNVFNINNPNTGENLAIKFCKFDLTQIDKWSEKRILRFSREIEALEQSKIGGLNRIIEIKFNDTISIRESKFNYYVMEKANYDLTEYLNKNELSIQQSLTLCLEILEGIMELHDIGIYHRDIKPDNILHTSNGWKIGDLGLIGNRSSDFEIEEYGEKIGPIGWLSPEAANKFLCEGKGKNNRNKHNCILNEKSDIFQLGKLFWYVFQGNIPIGQISESDFNIDDTELFDLLFQMLSHSKSKRYDLSTLQNEFNTKSRKYAI